MVFLGRGHSASDIAILVPEEKVLLMGCFFFERGPLPVFGMHPELDVDRWLQVLDSFHEAGRAVYEEMAADDCDLFFDETEFNRLGYRYLGAGRVDEAIAVFEMNVDRFPESWNVYDSLGEACAAKGDNERAIGLYRQSVKLNSDNSNGVQAIARLRTP
jgi:tetratricopeptide (TPR) repeat protein